MLHGVKVSHTKGHFFEHHWVSNFSSCQIFPVLFSGLGDTPKLPLPVGDPGPLSNTAFSLITLDSCS